MSVRGKVVIRRSRRGKVLTVAREHYLRDDIACGSKLCRVCPEKPLGAAVGRLGAASEVYIVPDVSAVLDQTDVLLSGLPPFKDILFLETVLDEVRVTSGKIYNRVKDALLKDDQSTANYAIFSNEHHRETYVERSDGIAKSEYVQMSITVSVQWLQQHWIPIKKHLVLLTDRESDAKIGIQGVEVVTVKTYVDRYVAKFPVLRELLAEPTEDDGDEMEDDGARKRTALFPSYLAEAEAKRKVKNGKLFQGTFHASRFNRLEGFVNVPLDVNDPDSRTGVLVQGRENLNRAIDNDVVVIELLPKSEWKTPSRMAVEEGDDSEDEDGEMEKEDGADDDVIILDAIGDDASLVPTGKVVAVAKRNWRPYGGSLDALHYNGGDSILFMPAEKAIPKIKIRSRRIPDLLKKRVQVVIDSWTRNSMHPSGHILREIGSAGDLDAETELILLENDIPTRKFSTAAMDCLPRDSWQVTEENIKSRWDFRSRCIVSVDPPGCTDIDDALHCEEVEQGVYEVGVHIADVTAFLRHGSVLDQEALERGTTVYLVDRRIEMLPSLLTSNLCSLKGEVERLAFSVIFRLDEEANELSVDFGRAVIKSVRAMTYQEAQERIDSFRDMKVPEKEVDLRIAKSLCGLAKLAEKLRQRRVEAGALSLASPEIKFKFEEESHEVRDVETYQLRETNRMVEEFMLLANVAVAQKILRHFPQCAMLRRHPKPLPEQFESLVKTASSFGVDLDLTSSKTLNDSLNLAEKKFVKEDAYIGTLLRILTTRCMTQAVYFSSGEVSEPEYIHYGLAANVYTHFTSPIRRYADVIVHRLLSSCLGYSSLPEDLQNSKKIQETADLINYRNRCAQYAARASISLHTMLFLKGKEIEEEARIVRLLKNAVVVLVPKFGVEGVAYVDPQSRSGAGTVTAVLDEDEMTLRCNDGRSYRIMDKVRVRVGVDMAVENREGVKLELV